MKEIKFLDLKAQYPLIEREIRKRFDDIIARSGFVSGKYVKEFEDSFAKCTGTKYAIAVSDGTTALWAALLAKGIGVGDEVIVPANTFIATAEAVSLTGAKPVFVDIGKETYLMDPRQIANHITKRTKAIIPVHLYGESADMDAIGKIARAHELFVLEDACQAHGAEYKKRKVGSLGHAAAFSFYPGKNLGTWGEGGAVVTNDKKLAEKIRLMRDHGSPQKYVHTIVGANFRMNEFEAAVLGVKLPHLKKWNKKRALNARIYFKKLARIPEVQLPRVAAWNSPVWHLLVIQVPDRDALALFLKDNGIQTGIHYPTPLHLTPAYAHLGYIKGDFPNAEKAQGRILSLPMYAELPEEDISYVSKCIKEFYER